MLVSAIEKNAARISSTTSAPSCADKGMSSIYKCGALSAKIRVQSEKRQATSCPAYRGASRYAFGPTLFQV